MTRKTGWAACVLCAAFAVSASAQSQDATPPAPPDRLVVPDYTHGASWFPTVAKPYQQAPVQPVNMNNSPRLHDLIRNGTLELSLTDALMLAIENNLDISVQRLTLPIAQTDILRTSSGQAARGVTGALVPSGLNQGALGVGVNAAAGIGGVGAAGGISGGGGAVFIGQSGNFDPTVSINASYDRTVSPLNSIIVAGVPTVTTYSGASSVNYAQLFPEGSSFTMSVNGIAQNSTQNNLLFNPAVVSRMALGFNQPLLSGFGFLPNKRFVMVAANNLQTSRDLFTEQVTTAVVQMEDAYWNLTAARQQVDASQQAYKAAQQLVSDTQTKVQFGTAARVDVTSAQSAAASAERDLVVAQTNVDLQQAQLKAMLSKQMDPDLERAQIRPTDPLPNPSDAPAPAFDEALKTAIASRPELSVASRNLKNQDITVAFTKNGLLPAVSAFGMYAAAGLAGDTLNVTQGLGTSLYQDVNGAYPEYAAGVSATFTLRNRSAQADSLRARLEDQQLQVQMKQSQRQISLEVRQAIISLEQGRAQVQSAREAVRLASDSVDAEQAKFDAGLSTPYNIVLRQRDLLTARQAQVTAEAAYARALVDFDRATGQTLDRNGIRLSDAIVGEVSSRPTPTGVVPAPQAPAAPGAK